MHNNDDDPRLDGYRSAFFGCRWSHIWGPSLLPVLNGLVFDTSANEFRVHADRGPIRNSKCLEYWLWTPELTTQSHGLGVEIAEIQQFCTFGIVNTESAQISTFFDLEVVRDGVAVILDLSEQFAPIGINLSANCDAVRSRLHRYRAKTKADHEWSARFCRNKTFASKNEQITLRNFSTGWLNIAAIVRHGLIRCLKPTDRRLRLWAYEIEDQRNRHRGREQYRDTPSAEPSIDNKQTPKTCQSD